MSAELEEKQDEEQGHPLIAPQLSECSLWIALPRPNDFGEFPVTISLDARGVSDVPGVEKFTFGRKMEFADAIKAGLRFDGVPANIFHTTFTLKSQDISKISFCMFADDFKAFSVPPTKFVPEGQEKTFWNEQKMVNLMIVRYGNVYFRGRFEKELTGYSRFRVQQGLPALWKAKWDLITDAEFGRYKNYTEEDQVVAKEKEMKTLEPRWLLFDTAIQELRKWCNIDSIHMVCRCWLFSNELVKVSTFKDHICESDIYRQLDLSPFRQVLLSQIRSADGFTRLFASALEDVRGEFVRLVPQLVNPMEHEFEEVKRRFDQNFLSLANWVEKEGKMIKIVYDDRRGELQLVESSFENDASYFLLKDDHEERSILFAVRQNWIKYQCLHGQDDEFNIFRSLCFAPPSSVVERYQIGFVALTLQILLSIGIAMDTVQMWSNKYSSFEDFVQKIESFEYQFEDTLIVIICIFTFAFILQRLRKTIESFKRFYRNMKEVCVIPNIIIAMDFASNIVVGTFMAIVTPFFLLQSEDIQTVVLNSFALTFFIELDDLANIYESDEPFLLQEDKNGMERGDQDRQYPDNEPGVIKRKITGMGSVYKKLQMTGAFLLSPFLETFKIIVSLVRMCCCAKERRQDPLIQSRIDN